MSSLVGKTITAQREEPYGGPVTLTFDDGSRAVFQNGHDLEYGDVAYDLYTAQQWAGLQRAKAEDLELKRLDDFVQKIIREERAVARAWAEAVMTHDEFEAYLDKTDPTRLMHAALRNAWSSESIRAQLNSSSFLFGGTDA